jgi:hypothetical protein
MDDRNMEPIDGRKQLERFFSGMDETPLRVMPQILPKGAKLSESTRISQPGSRRVSRRDRLAADSVARRDSR